MATGELDRLIGLHDSSEGGLCAEIKIPRSGNDEEGHIYSVRRVEEMYLLDEKRAMLVARDVLEEEGRFQAGRIPVLVGTANLDLECKPGTNLIRGGKIANSGLNRFFIPAK